MSDFYFSTDKPVTAGNISATLPAVFLLDNTDLPLLCGTFQVSAGGDPTATVQLILTFGSSPYIFTSQVFTLTSAQYVNFVLPYVTINRTFPVSISYTVEVSGISGGWELELRIK